MATKKNNITMLISQHIQPPQDLKRGQGLVLSTESAPPATTVTPSTPTTLATSAEPKRTNRGFTVRTDVIKLLRQVAFEEDRHLYLVVEEALIAYLKKKHRL